MLVQIALILKINWSQLLGLILEDNSYMTDNRRQAVSLEGLLDLIQIGYRLAGQAN